MIENNIFSCDPLPKNNGYTWTIVSLFGDMLSAAEELFGERDKKYTMLGIELVKIDQPQIWFPGSCNHVIIQVTEDCISDMDKAIFQVAHEAVHCLCPQQGKKVSILEEGVATYFSMLYTNKQNISYIELPQYQYAYKLSSQLLKYDSEIIKKARKFIPDISNIDKKLLLNICPNIGHALAEEITKAFVKDQ